MAILDVPEHADPMTVGNVGAMLVTHLIAKLLQKGVLAQADVQAIFQDTRKGYTKIPAPLTLATDWARQADMVLTLLEQDVVKFSAGGD